VLTLATLPDALPESDEFSYATGQFAPPPGQDDPVASNVLILLCLFLQKKDLGIDEELDDSNFRRIHGSANSFFVAIPICRENMLVLFCN
jgi:hypothetical protein